MGCRLAGQGIISSLLSAIHDDFQKGHLTNLIQHYEEYAGEFQIGLGGISREDRFILESEYPILFATV